MNSMQRQFGKLIHKGGGDDAKVSVLLQDFEEADKMLAKVFVPRIRNRLGLISTDH
jgi:amphiphysin